MEGRPQFSNGGGGARSNKMAQLKKAAADRKNQRLHEDILEEQGIPEEKEEEATQDQEPSSTVTVLENLSLNTNANNSWGVVEGVAR